MAEANVINNNNLPPEVLTKIFEHCRPNLTELVNIVDVCQLSRDAAIREYNRSGNDLVIRQPDDINNLVSLLCKPVSFTKLHIVWDVPSDVDCSSVSLDALANVTSLTGLQSFTFKLKVGIEDGQFGDKVLDALLMLVLQTSTETLTRLKLYNVGRDGSGPTRRSIVQVIEACHQLSHLVLDACWLIGYEQRCLDAIPTLSHLKLLDLRDTSVSLNLSFIAAVKRGCPHISNNIMIHKLYVLASDDVSLLHCLSYVGRLRIGQLNTERLISLISCLNERVSRLPVDALDFLTSNDLTDEILLSIVQRVSGLKSIELSWCHQLTNEGVVNVITSSPQLTWIYIEDIKNIDTNIIQLLDRVTTKQNMDIYARGTKLRDQLGNIYPAHQLYTGRNGNIRLRY